MAEVQVLLGLGSNLGDRLVRLREALAGIAGLLALGPVSSVYETAPMYDTDQGPFLNLAASGRTDRPARDLLAALKAVEQAVGRTPSRRFGPRAIDIDLLLYGEAVLADDVLEVPHPRMAERAFVLVPAAEIAGAWRHPVTGRTLAEMRDALPADDGIRRAGPAPWPPA